MKEQAIKAPFQLLSHSVDELNIKNRMSILNADVSKTLKDVSIKDAHVNESTELFIGDLTLFISTQCKNKANPRETISVKLTISGIFTGKKDSIDKEAFQKMVVTNGTTSLYSIARAIITTTTSQCLSSGQVTLPMINVLKLLNNIDVSFSSDDSPDDAEEK